MIARRIVLQWIAALTGRGAIPRSDPGSAPATIPPPLETSARWFLDIETGESWPAADFFQWFDWNIPAATIDRARQGLEPNIGPQQLERLLRRRRSQCLIQVQAPWPQIPRNPITPADQRVVFVSYWGSQPPDARPFLRAHGLTRRCVFVRLDNRETGALAWANAADYLAGRPSITDLDVENFVGRWLRRHEAHADRSMDDWSIAVRRDTGLRWRQLDGPGIPWAAIENAWLHVTPPRCPECGGPMAASGFGTLTAPGALHAGCEILCVDCLAHRTEPVADIRAWCQTHLDPDYRPTET